VGLRPSAVPGERRERDVTLPGIRTQDDAGRWLRRPEVFPDEATLHGLIEETPEMLPLSGAPSLLILGREVSLLDWCCRVWRALSSCLPGTGRSSTSPRRTEMQAGVSISRRYPSR